LKGLPNMVQSFGGSFICTQIIFYTGKTVEH
jgi:hypothetical protein